MKPYQELLVGWQDTYNIYAGSPSMVIDNFDEFSFNTEDFKFQSDLLAGKSVSASEYKSVHGEADHEFVKSFNPNADDVDMILFEQITK